MGVLDQLLVPLVVTFGVATGLTALLIFLFKKLRWSGVVRQERWAAQPRPHFGGIAIFVAFISGTFLFEGDQAELKIIALCASGIFLLGLMDDLLDLKPTIKLIFQIALASVVTNLGVVVAFVDDQVLAMTLTVAWIVFITNAFNLLDNMDGLSGGIAIITMISFMLIDLLNGSTGLGLPAIILIGSVAGFLVFNFPPAKIFMGDSGSLLIGFLLAVYSIKGSWQQASNLFLLMATPALLLGVPVFDTIVVSLQRMLHGRPITEGGKDHSSHRLVALGLSEKQAVLALYGIAAAFGAIAVVSFAFNIFVASQLVILLLVTMVTVGVLLSDAKIYQRLDADQAVAATTVPPKHTIPIPRLMHKRRLIEVLSDAVLITVAYISSYLLRFDGEISLYNWKLIQSSLPIVVSVKLVTLLVMGCYGGIWKYIDFVDARRIFLSLAVASVATITALLGVYRFSGFSRTLFIIDFLLLAFLTVGYRVLLRVLRESFYSYAKFGTKVLIIGAGEAGQWLLNEIRKDRRSRLVPVGIIDDDRWKRGRKVYGIEVIGNSQEILKISKELEVQEIIVAIPSLTLEQREKLMERCKPLAIPIRMLEGITRWSMETAGLPSAPGGTDSSRNDSSSGPPSPSDREPLH